MSKISIVMPVYNGEQYIAEAIESTLKQTFEDFEFLIIDDGSEDQTLSIVRSYKDSRIVILQNNHDFIGSLNKGIESATGKYIARMDADDLMHTDRLQIQHAIMEEEPDIAICGTWIHFFGEKALKGQIYGGGNGWIEFPVLELLKKNFISHPTTMIRSDFFRKHGFHYVDYTYAEDYKLWFEIAKQKGIFFITPEPLLFYRTSQEQVSTCKRKEQYQTSLRIKQEILEYLIEKNRRDLPELIYLHNDLHALQQKKLISQDYIFTFFYEFFSQNKIRFQWD